MSVTANLKDNDQWAIVCRLIELLREQGSWGGETHLQKATYLLKFLAEVPLNYRFVLYKHGPFSFDLRDEIDFLRGARAICKEPQGQYGPKLSVLKALTTDASKGFEDRLLFVAQTVGQKTVKELEALSTALMVTLENGDRESRVQRLLSLKPHLDSERAEEAVSEIDSLRDAFSHQFCYS